MKIAQADDAGLVETVDVMALLQLRRRRTRTGRQDRRRSSCPDQASRGSICQASATKVRRNAPGGCQYVEAGSNTATGLPVVSGIHATSGQMAHQRKLGHLEVPVSSSTVSRRSINSGLGWPNCAAPPLLVIARSYRLPNIPSWSDPSTGCTRSRTLEHGEDQLLASVQRRPRRSVAEPDVRDARAVLTSYQGRAPRVLFSWDRRPEVLGWFRHRPSRGLTDRHALVKLRQEVLEVGHLLNAVIEPRFSHRPGPHPGRQ